MGGEEKPVVAFLGPRASYTHQATLDAFNETDYTLSPQITIEDVFAAVENGEAHRGVVPFENSSNGSVVFTLDLFADLQGKYPDILVCGESYIAVQHCLLGFHSSPDTAPSSTSASGNPVLSSIIESPLSSGAATPTSRNPTPIKPTARPIGDLSRIKKIYSHPQAWGQCKTFLNTYLKHTERQDVSSTSKAAELVAKEGPDGCSAAISSGIAARLNSLDILARGIEDMANNTTRFFVIRKASSPSLSTPPALPPPSSSSQPDSTSNTWKTLISFTIDHANPGALAHSLAVFEKYGLNLTSINTRPSGVENWNYIFFVELKGRKEEGEDGAVNGALRDLEGVARGHRWLGSWENRLGVGRF